MSVSMDELQTVPPVKDPWSAAQGSRAHRSSRRLLGRRPVAHRDLFAEYNSLVRMAASLVSDIDVAEDVVQDSIVAMHGAWPKLRDRDKVLAYMRQSVMNRARSVIRRRMVVDRHPPKPEPNAPSAEYSAITELERSEVISALRLLPPRQREVLVLRFYFGLREGQIAATMGITRGTVKAHIRRAMAAMRDLLAPAEWPELAEPHRAGDGRVLSSRLCEVVSGEAPSRSRARPDLEGRMSSRLAPAGSRAASTGACASGS